MNQHINQQELEKIRMRTKSFKERPLMLNGIDPLKYMEQAKADEMRPYMSLYCVGNTN